MGRKEELLNRLGANMNESIGNLPPVHGEPPVPTEAAARGDKYRGRRQSRSSGELDLDRIVIDPHQPRKHFDADKLHRLAESIRQNGVLQPIGVRWDGSLNKWIILYGERRFRAAKLAGLTAIPCMFVEHETDEASVRIRQIVENCQREDLAPTEQAEGIRSLMEITGWSTQRVADELQLSKATVVRSLALLKLPEEVKAKVDTGEIAASVGYSLSRVRERPKQRELATQVIDRKLTRDATEALIRSRKGPNSHQTRHRSVEPNSATSAGNPKAGNPNESPRTTRRFETRRAVVIVEHENVNATNADLQATLLAVVKQLGAAVAQSKQEK